ncbi:MAG: tRNA uridine-5-carboxymethylaminomethyl(34) synthesis GTPase MnmE, partial [Proteobacteria bacterium]|nr:tRNA uridine-5-carboxymethylaminomethyl(34) synthesis GTPase MnmE [Pseudomonadota bacterium]
MERYRDGDTIVALASGALPSGVAVIRLSGPAAWVAGAMVFPKLVGADVRRVVWGKMLAGDEEVDAGLAMGFRAPASFTGEDVVELHCHGGRAVVRRVLDELCGMDDVRLALAGEFTRRAVLNGKLDLTAAEGLADLIGADTEAQRRQALRQLDGALGERFESWRSRILSLLAQVEAAIDFPDEELEVLAEPALAAGMRGVLADLQAAEAEQAGVRLRDGLQLAIVGRPNAGKSTLLNVLSGQELAITSPTAGTTRDVVRGMLEVGGYPLLVADTAGLRETEDKVEAEGVRRAKAVAARAEVIVLVQDAGAPLDEDLLQLLVAGRSLVVLSKADLVGDKRGWWQRMVGGEVEDFGNVVEVGGVEYPAVAVDLTAEGARGRVLAALQPLVEQVAGGASEAALLTRERHRVAVREAIAALGRALIRLGR